MGCRQFEESFFEISALDVYANGFFGSSVLVECSAFAIRLGVVSSADSVRQRGGGQVHFLHQRTGRQIAHKFASRLDIWEVSPQWGAYPLAGRSGSTL
jgi:hypothetical protein